MYTKDNILNEDIMLHMITGKPHNEPKHAIVTAACK